MKKKFDYAIEFLLQNKNFVCPMCKKNLVLRNNSLYCASSHTYDISKKGIVTLIKSSKYKKSTVYNSNLFLNRRDFINNNYYNDIYDYIAGYLNNYFGNSNIINILDIGCGEGTHSIKILERLIFKYNYYGFDYSKDAINLASDYLSTNIYFFVADLTNIPLATKTIDVALDFLSPYNESEIRRLLKSGGLLIKVTPGKNYLKELRRAQNISEYINETDVLQNIEKHFNICKKENIKTKIKIAKKDAERLNNMTPIKDIKDNISFEEVTIDLNVYVIKGD